MTDIKNYMENFGFLPDQFLDAIRQYLKEYNEIWYRRTITITNLQKRAENEPSN